MKNIKLYICIRSFLEHGQIPTMPSISTLTAYFIEITMFYKCFFMKTKNILKYYEMFTRYFSLLITTCLKKYKLCSWLKNHNDFKLIFLNVIKHKNVFLSVKILVNIDFYKCC